MTPSQHTSKSGRDISMKRQPVIFNEQRLQAMMDHKKIHAVILRGTENSKYISEFFHNGGNLGYRPFTVFYFRDPARKPAFVVPAVDLHLAIDSTWIEDVRAYAMASSSPISTCISTRTSSRPRATSSTSARSR